MLAARRPITETSSEPATAADTPAVALQGRQLWSWRFPLRLAEMNFTEELQKLAELHQAGHLTDQEFGDAKRRLIADSRTAPLPSPGEGGADPEGGAPIAEKTYRSSRWSTGNLFFPDRLTLASDGMLFRKGAMFGSSEEHINYLAVASIRVKNGIFLSNVTIETSGGSQPIFINGIWKSKAREIQDTIRVFQRSG